MEEVTKGYSKSSSNDISTDKGELTKNFDQICFWYYWKGYRSGSLTNGYRDASTGGIGHQRLLKVTNQVHLKR